MSAMIAAPGVVTTKKLVTNTGWLGVVLNRSIDYLGEDKRVWRSIFRSPGDVNTFIVRIYSDGHYFNERCVTREHIEETFTVEEVRHLDSF